FAAQRRFREMAAPHVDEAIVLGAYFRDDGIGTAMHHEANAGGEQSGIAAHCGAGPDATNENPADRSDASPGNQRVLRATPAELVAVAPGRELGTLRLTDAHERRAVGHLREPDVVGRDAFPRVSIELLGLFDRLPAFVEGREVPALAAAAHHPQPA